MNFIRSYQLKSYLNEEKLVKVNQLFKPYQELCKLIANQQWNHFYLKGKFDKNLKIKPDTKLSARYIQTANYQVVGTLNSYLSNVKNRFKDVVFNSSINDEQTLKELFTINKAGKWLDNNYKPEFASESKIIAKKIFKRLTKNKPSFKYVNLNLDFKVCKLASKEVDKATHFDYWLKLSTLEKGSPIDIPLLTNHYFDESDGLLMNFVQINRDREGQVSFRLIKQASPKLIKLTAKKLGLDLGIVNFIVSNYGDLYGGKYLKYLEVKKAQRNELFSNLMAQGIKPSSSKRYVRLGRKIKSYIKNEVCRLVNKIFKQYLPSEIVIEKLDFRGSKLGRKTNSRISNFGKKVFNDKVARICEENQVKLTVVNPAYTSQACNRCYSQLKKRTANPLYQRSN